MEHILKVLNSITPPTDLNSLWLKPIANGDYELLYHSNTKGWVVVGLTQEEIEELMNKKGKFLSNWNSVTGKPETNPENMPYSYTAGDYYLINQIGTVEAIAIAQTVGTGLTLQIHLDVFKEYAQPTGNTTLDFVYSLLDTAWTLDSTVVDLADYGIEVSGIFTDGDTIEVTYTAPSVHYKPVGNTYNNETSTTIETGAIQLGDIYIYDGTTWLLQTNTQRMIPVDETLSLLSTNPVENRVVTQAIQSIPKPVYIAIENVTTYTELLEAYNAGKTIAVQAMGNTWCYLYNYSEAGQQFTFYSLSEYTVASTPNNTKYKKAARLKVTVGIDSTWAYSDSILKVEIIDSLNSTETYNPLSANQGKVLDKKKADKTYIENMEFTIASALNNLNARLAVIENALNLTQP